MKRELTLQYEFVEFIPDHVQDGMIYVAVAYATAVHKCCCGCGSEVITPLSPTDWTLIFDGQSVSLNPSIGNWSFPCQSHYWIIRSRVKWARHWSQKEIDAGRAYDLLAKERYFSYDKTSVEDNFAAGAGAVEKGKPKVSFWSRLKRLFF